MIYSIVFFIPNDIKLLNNIIVKRISFDLSHNNYITMTYKYSIINEITSRNIFLIIKIIVNNLYFT